MGEPIGSVLLKQGHELDVFQHRNHMPVERLVGQGAKPVTQLISSAAEADVVLSMLPNLPEIESLLFEQGIFENMKMGTLFLNMSTVSPKGIQDLARKLTSKGIDILDGPVSGGTTKAKSGTLTIMVGGETSVYQNYLPLLQSLGENIYHTGPVGSGQVVKLCNNLLCAMTMTATAEVLALGVKAGVDAGKMREIIMQSTGANWVLNKKVPSSLLIDNYEPGFALQLMYKDVSLAMELSKDMTTPMLLGGLTEQMYRSFMGEETKELDFSIVSKYYENAANIRIADGKTH